MVHYPEGLLTQPESNLSHRIWLEGRLPQKYLMTLPTELLFLSTANLFYATVSISKISDSAADQRLIFLIMLNPVKRLLSTLILDVDQGARNTDMSINEKLGQLFPG